MYNVQAGRQVVNQVIVSVVFTNLTLHMMKDLELNILNTLNMKLAQGVSYLSMCLRQ